MKKLVSLLLAVCMCLSVGVMLTACGHEHTYKTEWSKDATHHWHACEGEDCTEVSDKAEHTWNDGEITTEATADADGVKTFTCTVCEQTKTEAFEYVPDHTVKTEWSKDATHHWHACEGEGCTDVADKTEHTWNDGEVTTHATAEANGVKTFTCTVCEQTKTEAFEYVPDHTVTQEEWRSALAKENFYNVTLIYSEYRYSDSDGENESAELGFTSRIEYDGTLMRSHDSISVNSGDMDTDEVFSVVSRALEHYADAEYDEEAQQYFLMLYDDYYEMMFGLIYQFTDGKLTHFELHFLQKGTADEMYKSRWMEWKFSNYGTTVITEGAE